MIPASNENDDRETRLKKFICRLVDDFAAGSITDNQLSLWETIADHPGITDQDTAKILRVIARK